MGERESQSTDIAVIKPPSIRQRIHSLFPGLFFCAMVALAATYITEHYGGPLILFTLLLGMAFTSINNYREYAEGIAFCAKNVLRIGVALLGARITFTQISELGYFPLLLVGVAVITTVIFSICLGRLLKIESVHALISGAAVAICGVSAAIAVAAVLPGNKHSEKYLLCTLISVTGLSTLAMILYPALLTHFSFSPEKIGLFLGASIHDVAQVFGAGHIISNEVGELATYTKMLRVATLVPFVLLLTVLFRSPNQTRMRALKIPGFLVAFVALVVLSNINLLPGALVHAMNSMSQACLILAMVALGTKTNLIDLHKVGWRSFLLLLANTLFIALAALLMLIY